MPKLNGNTGWIVTLMIALLGWAYMIGWQGRATIDLERHMETKANKEVVEVQLESINSKLADILKRIQD